MKFEKKQVYLTYSKKSILFRTKIPAMLITALFIFGTVVTTNLHADDMEKAMKAVFGNKQKKNLKINGHGFNVKPAKLTQTADGLTMKLVIDHRLRFADDDTVIATIRKDKYGQIIEILADVKRSKVRKVLREAFKIALEIAVAYGKKKAENYAKDTKALTTASELKTLEDTIARVEKNIGKGGWERAAASIIANAAIRADMTVSLRTSKVTVRDRIRVLRNKLVRKSRRKRSTSSRRSDKRRG